MKNLDLDLGRTDNFDKVKHVYHLKNAEIFTIRKLENGLYFLNSEDNTGNVLLVTNDELQTGFMPIELLSNQEVIYFPDCGILSKVEDVLLKRDGTVN